MLVACGTAPLPQATSVPQPSAPLARPEAATSLDAIVRGNSRWQPVAWAELPGFDSDALFEAWNAWLKSCERPGPVFAPLCPEVRRLSIGSEAEQRKWLLDRLQPYRVEPLPGVADGRLADRLFRA